MAATHRLFRRYEKLGAALPAQSDAKAPQAHDAAAQKDKPEYKPRYNEYVKMTNLPCDDENIAHELTKELDNFCEELLSHIQEANRVEAGFSALFLAKLIDYIGRCGSKATINPHVVRYLLKAFTKVIDMAGTKGKDEKEKKKSQKAVLVHFIS